VTAYGKQLTTGCRSTTVRAGTGYSAPFCDLGILSRIDTILAYHEIPEGSAVRERHPHPSQQPLLPLVMVVSVLAGVISLRVDGKHSALLATFAFAWFLVSFALYGYAWILRDNGEWRESRRDRTP
jgi:hypothetical protein